MHNRYLISVLPMKFLFFFICSLIYLSSHAQQEWKMHTIDDTSFGADGTKIYDVNRDGYLDIISGWEQGNVARLYLNPQQVDQDWPFIEVPAPQVEDALVVDLDEDGFITREEWLGTDAVFDALDANKDGKITPEEMGAGLGAVLQLAKTSA